MKTAGSETETASLAGNKEPKTAGGYFGCSVK